VAKNFYDPLEGNCQIVRYPRVPHLIIPSGVNVWQGEHVDPKDVDAWIQSTTWHVEEWVDGVEVAVSVDDAGRLRLQSGGQVLNPKKYGQYTPLRDIWNWLELERHVLEESLWPNLTFYGTWCRIARDVHYDSLPDYMIFHSVGDRDKNEIFCPEARDELLDTLGYKHPTKSEWANLENEQELLITADMDSEFCYHPTPAKGIYLVESDLDTQVYKFRVMNPMAIHGSVKSQEVLNALEPVVNLSALCAERDI
jgi:hypothetical protein